jgi:hypothetical protein
MRAERLTFDELERLATQPRRQPQTRTGFEFHRYVEQLLAAQPRTVTGYRARLAAVEELVRQTDALAR